MKKIICLSAAASLIAALAIGVGAAGEEKIVLSAPEGSYAVGETVTVTISVEDIGEFNTFMFYDPVYDEEYLEWVGGDWLLDGGTMSDYYTGDMNGSSEKGRSGVYYTGDAAVSDNADIVTMEFKVLKESENAQTVSCSVIVKNDETELVNGSVGTEVTLGEGIEKFNLSGATMTLGNNLAINFVIDTSKLDGTGHYAVITKEYADGRDNVVVTVEQTEWEKYSGNLYYFTFDGVSAKEMTDKLLVEVYNKDGNKVIYDWTDSVRDYAMRGVTKELNNISTLTDTSKIAESKEKLTLYVDMLNYGAAAQSYFDNYHADDLANSTLTAEAQTYATGDLELTDCRVKGDGYAGSTLTLKSQIQMNYVFNKSTVTTDMYAVVTYTNHYGTKKTLTITGAEFVEYSSTRWYIPVTGMSVADCSSPLTLTIYNSDDTVVTTVVDSVESYVCRSVSMDEVYMAIMKFATAAYNSFH